MKKKIIFNSIGSDPELFITKDGKIISAEGIIGGTKAEPRSLSREGFFVQEDNIMAEFNIPPSLTIDSFISNMNEGLKLVKSVLPDASYDILVKASSEVDPKFLNTEQAQMFGCDKDFDCWSEDINDTPDPNTNLRTCGGHVHIGYETEDIDTSFLLAKYLDLTLSIPSLILDEDERRKTMYGKAGAMRFKHYGLEYRSLSNFWINKDDMLRFVFNGVIRAIEMYNDNTELPKGIKEAINNNNKKVAEKLIKQFNLI